MLRAHAAPAMVFGDQDFKDLTLPEYTAALLDRLHIRRDKEDSGMVAPCAEIAGITAVKPPGVRMCEACVMTGDSWVHLRTCQTCGVTLCCDSSPNRATLTFAPLTLSASRDSPGGIRYYPAVRAALTFRVSAAQDDHYLLID
jgi:hypothetical protein